MTDGDKRSRGREGLGTFRLAMVLSSLSPLFILWGARGTQLFPDHCF